MNIMSATVNKRIDLDWEADTWDDHDSSNEVYDFEENYSHRGRLLPVSQAGRDHPLPQPRA